MAFSGGLGAAEQSYNKVKLTDGVLAGEAVAGQHSLHAGNEVIDSNDLGTGRPQKPLSHVRRPARPPGSSCAPGDSARSDGPRNMDAPVRTDA